MKENSIWKNVMLLTFGSILALHIQVVKASDDSSTSTVSTSGDEECVITDDQYKRIN